MFKKTTTILTIGIVIATAVTSLILSRPSVNSKKPKFETKLIASGRWAKKQAIFKPSGGKFIQAPRSFKEVADIATASKLLGFEIKLPKNPKATAAGEPKIYLPKGTAQDLAKEGTPPKPDNPIHGGGFVRIEYPNGLLILIKIRHPQDPTKNYQLHVEDTNKMKKYWTERGYMDGKYLQLTTVNGFEGMQEDAGFNFVGFLGHDTPTPELREPTPAMVVWYDNKNWAEYFVTAPIGVSLKELREVVDSIY